VTRLRTAISLWVLALVGVVCCVTEWRAAVPVPEPVAVTPFGQSGAAPAISVSSLNVAAGRVVATDLFRLDRAPARLSYTPDSADIAPTVNAHQPRAQLVLQGILGVINGSKPERWGALLGGIPGHPSPVLVHAGDTIGGMTVRRVGRDTLVVVAPDTLWRLTVRQAWP
jgi:hypothetical protein